ncbi:MAG: ribosome small subunit-dependent GTPase [Bacteroidota bacterium]|jgi:ribosome biogenesis GTPase
MKGTVTKSTGSWYQVTDTEGRQWNARTRGKLRLTDTDTSNPVAVGDEVLMKEDFNYADTATIIDISPRKNYIIRKSNKLSSKRQILAANLDAAVLVASLVSPRTSLGFIDRFLLCGEAFHIPTWVFFNKMDLLSEQQQLDITAEIKSIYKNANVHLYFGSVAQNLGLDPLRNLLIGKRILLAGHSGVGKSTLLNKLFPEANARVGSISKTHEKGKHTTTFAEMFRLPNNTEIIDTPGIRDFGVVDMEQHEIAQYFPEFRSKLNDCKFNNCTHIHEPGCAVLDSVESENIHPARYHSYLSIYHNEDIFE